MVFYVVLRVFEAVLGRFRASNADRGPLTFRSITGTAAFYAVLKVFEAV